MAGSEEKAPAAGMTKAAFHDAWSQIAPLILGEWEQIDEEALEKTEGDLDKVAALVAERAGRTRAMARRLLFELYQVAIGSDPATRTRASQRRQNSESPLPESVEAMVHELERRAAQVMRELRGGFVQKTTHRIHENLIFSLLVTLGLGFIVGVLFTGSGRGRS